MQPFPHQYDVSAKTIDDQKLLAEADNLPDITVTPPAHFDGPGDQWSPEHLLVSSAASCFILTFKAIARASKLEWSSLEVSTQGTLDKVDRQIKFTRLDTKAHLTISDESLREKAEKLLHKAEENCLINNSLDAEKQLSVEISLA